VQRGETLTLDELFINALRTTLNDQTLEVRPSASGA